MQARWGRQNGDSPRIAGYRSMTAGGANNNCDGGRCSLPHRPPRVSESLFITASMDDHDEQKTTEHNLCIRADAVYQKLSKLVHACRTTACQVGAFF